MKKDIIKEEVAEEARPAPQLRIVTGSKGPEGFNWLSGLKPGTCFLCRPYKHKGPFLEEYHVVFQGERSTKLFTNLNQEGYFVVDPLIFCGIMDLIEVVIEGEE